jgi:predicted N-acetyltransferase YhbS
MTEWRSGPLTNAHDLVQFDCGVPSLTQWLMGHALRAQKAGTARTYVWTAPDNPRVTAYYSIAPTRVVREEVSSGQAGGESIVPAYLLARLALDTSLHGQGLGGELLFDAMDRMVDAADRAGGRLIVVDAVDDRAASFYHRHGFTPVKGNPRRLVIKIETARRALDKPGGDTSSARATRTRSPCGE